MVNTTNPQATTNPITLNNQRRVRVLDRARQILKESGLHGGTTHMIEIEAGVASANEEAAGIIRDLLRGFDRTSSSDFMADEIDAANEWLKQVERV